MKKTVIPSTTIQDLKEFMEDEIKINVSHQTLLFSVNYTERVCDNNSETMVEIGIQNESLFKLKYNTLSVMGLSNSFFDDLWKLQNENGSFSLSYDIANLLNIPYSSLMSLIPVSLPDNNYDIWITCLVIAFLQHKFGSDTSIKNLIKDAIQKATTWVLGKTYAKLPNDVNIHELATARIIALC